MHVTVHYLAQLRRAAGCASERLAVEAGATLADLLARLGEQRGDPFRGLLLDEQSRIQKSLLVFVGEEHADASRPLRDGDCVTILTPMAGG